MSYQPEKLIELAVNLLRDRPRLTAAEVSEKLRVHRHTLRRALKTNGQSLAMIKRALVLEHLDRHDDQPSSLKDVWTGLGFASASAFARYIRHATGKSPTERRAGPHLGPFGTRKGQGEP